jgi:RNA polymerase-binding transcription factor DksA
MNRNIESRMNAVLRRLGECAPEHLTDEAEAYICALCDMERKPCEIHAGIKCSMMIKAGTELEHLRAAGGRNRWNTYGFCLRCSNPIESAALDRDPLAELCNSCNSRIKRV